MRTYLEERRKAEGVTMAGKKSSNAEIEFRVNFVHSIMVAGYRHRHQILEYIMRIDSMTDKERSKSKDPKIKEWVPWNLSDGMLDIYMNRARDIFKKNSRFDREEEIGKALDVLEDLYRKTIQAGKHQVAASIRKQVSEMMGIYVKRVKVDGSLTVDINQKRKDLEDRLDRIKTGEENSE